MKRKHGIELETLGARIKRRRKECGLNQDEVADRMGCSLTYISKLENGKATCNIERLFELSDILKCDMAFLLSGINKGSKQYLEPELQNMFGQLPPEEKELICAMMKVMIRRKQKDGTDYVVP